MVIVDISIIHGVYKFLSETADSLTIQVVRVETDRTCGIYLTHIFYYIRYNGELLFGTFQISVKIVKFHFVVYCPEYY